MARAKHAPVVGDIAPPIESATATGEKFSLAEKASTWTVVFFYPMANTPG